MENGKKGFCEVFYEKFENVEERKIHKIHEFINY